jgi:hypothetical protein
VYGLHKNSCSEKYPDLPEDSSISLCAPLLSTSEEGSKVLVEGGADSLKDRPVCCRTPQSTHCLAAIFNLLGKVNSKA